MNIIIPLAGKDPRFADAYKPFSDLGGRTLIEEIVKRLEIGSSDQLMFVVLKEHDEGFGVSKKLREFFGDKIIIRIIGEVQPGSVASILLALRDLIDDDEDVLVELGDVLRDTTQLFLDIKNRKPETAGLIPVESKNMQPRLWGYVGVNEKGEATELLEKEEIPSHPLATMGLYYFSHGKEFIWAAEEMMRKKSYVYKDAFFVGPMYNELIQAGKIVLPSMNKIEAVLGGPEDIAAYKK